LYITRRIAGYDQLSRALQIQLSYKVDCMINHSEWKLIGDMWLLEIFLDIAEILPTFAELQLPGQLLQLFSDILWRLLFEYFA